MSFAVRRGLDPLFPSLPPQSFIDRSFAVRRLTKNAVSLIATHPRAEFLGIDAGVTEMATSLGFKTNDLAILRIGIGAARHTLICVLEQVWYARKFDLITLKRLAARQNLSCVLVQERAIQRQPRLSNARSIEEATGVRVTPDDRMAVILHLIESGSSSSLLECAGAIDHPAPFSAILHLVALGVVRLDASRVISPESQVFLQDGEPEPEQRS